MKLGSVRKIFAIIGLAVCLCAIASPESVDKIVAVGDVHGDFDQFVVILRSAGVIDDSNRWAGGTTHLVQTGDVPDRGSGTRQVLDLLMELEKQAKRAGGAVHALIGNHEAMNVYGDLRYVTPDEFAAFRNDDSEQIRNRYFEQHLEQDPAAAVDARANPENYRMKWEAEHPLGWFEHRLAFAPNGKYGKWIAGHDVVLKLDSSLFLHGGISPKYVSVSIGEINKAIRRELKSPGNLNGAMATDPEGPLWYRGLADGSESELAEHVDRVLKAYGVDRIVIGHTVTDGTIMPRFGGKVLMIDVGMSLAYGSRQACLILEGGKAYSLHRGRKLAIPVEGGEALRKYLREAAALDPEPSPLLKRIEAIE